MNIEVLIPGLEFAKKHKLTTKEIETLFPFLKDLNSLPQLAKKLSVNRSTLDQTIQRLRLKNLIVLRSRDAKGTNIYEFNFAQIRDN